MSLLRKIADSIGGSIGVSLEEQTIQNTQNTEPPELIEVREKSKPIENRDDASATMGEENKKSSTVEEKDASSTKEEKHQDAMVEITNLTQAVQKDNSLSSDMHSHHHGIHNKDTMDDTLTSTSSVSFGSVRVREYERVIDSTQIYMGLALGWNYNEVGQLPVREKNKTSKYSVASSASHGGESRMKRTNGSDRYGMLIRYGYAQRELKVATKEAAQFYKQRSREDARSIVVADNREAQSAKKSPKRRLLRSMFG